MPFYIGQVTVLKKQLSITIYYYFLLLTNANTTLCYFPGHPNMAGPMQRMNPPRSMAAMGPQVTTQHTSI